MAAVIYPKLRDATVAADIRNGVVEKAERHAITKDHLKVCNTKLGK